MNTLSAVVIIGALVFGLSAIHGFRFRHPGLKGNSAPALKNLVDKDKECYELLIVPLLGKCAIEQFRLKDKFSREGKKRLCTTVEQLKGMFTDLNEQYKNPKGWQGSNTRLNEISKITQQIRELVLNEDLVNLRENFRNLVNDEDANSVESEVQQITQPKRQNLDTAFTETFGELKKYLNKSAAKRDTVKSRKIAYKLLRIGEEMKGVFNGEEEEGKYLAFQQFAANLAIYSLHLDKVGNANAVAANSNNGEEEEIQKIAQKWPIGMMDWIYPTPVDESESDDIEMENGDEIGMNGKVEEREEEEQNEE